LSSQGITTAHQDGRGPNRFLFHFHFAAKRHGYIGPGVAIEHWKSFDAFRIHRGSEDCLVFIYNSRERSEDGAAIYLQEVDYPVFVANGIIDPDLLLWQFVRPTDSAACRAIGERIVRDTDEFLRYYGQFRFANADGGDLGSVQKF
jgi:hypothetical protein